MPQGTPIRSLLAAAILSLTGIGAHAQTFPSKPVRILVPYAAGGAVDVLARTLGQSLSKTWGQQPVIENRPGAGGIIASQALTQSPPDGYTLILIASGHPLNQFFYPKLPYDTFKDFTAISEVAASPLAIVVSKTNPVKNSANCWRRPGRNRNPCPTACPATALRRIWPASCSTTWPR